jgi:ABC-2 type transport system ATP-binding protein
VTHPIIRFDGVSKTYQRVFSDERVEALRYISFEVEPGEVCAFLGPNGAGKTTSIGILMGFLFPDEGEVSVLGCEPGDIRAKSRIGFLPENFAFYKHLTGPKLLRFHMALAGIGAQGGEARIRQLLAQVGLQGYENLKIGKYSRGMVQRLGLAQALLAGPELLVLDEPTSGLDPAGRKEVLDLLNALKAQGKTVFLSSHILPEVEQICDRVVIIDRGLLLQTGKLSEMLAAAGQVEIVASGAGPEPAVLLEPRPVEIETTPAGFRVVAGGALKREIAELLWNAGYDVVSINPLRGSLEDLFLETVARHGRPS